MDPQKQKFSMIILFNIISYNLVTYILKVQPLKYSPKLVQFF